jgi:hypothetical protein
LISEGHRKDVLRRGTNVLKHLPMVIMSSSCIEIQHKSKFYTHCLGRGNTSGPQSHVAPGSALVIPRNGRMGIPNIEHRVILVSNRNIRSIMAESTENSTENSNETPSTQGLKRKRLPRALLACESCRSRKLRVGRIVDCVSLHLLTTYVV